MEHLGDITSIHGYAVPIVDIVTGGSPCQDLSVAGKRAGLDGARSGLFMEQIRIVKEMRDESARQLSMRRADVDIRFIQPRFMVWENVPGAFSSNKGEDFRCVLEEVCRIADKTATVPMPEKGKWSTSGCIMGDGWNVAWRVHDAQFWGVPQRRKRIALVADFGGESAQEILFERKGLSGNTEKSREEGQGTSNNIESCIDKTEPILLESNQNHATIQTDGISTALPASMGMSGGYVPMITDKTSYTLKVRGGREIDSKGHKAGKGALVQEELSATLGVSQDQTLITTNQKVYGFCSMGSNSMKSSNPHSGIYEADTSRTLDLNGGNPACNQGGMMVVTEGKTIFGEDIAGTLVSSMTTPTGTTQDKNVIMQETYQKTTGSLCASGYDKLGTQEALNDMYVVSAETFHCTTETEMVQTLKARDYKDPQIICNSVVRRLTPLECERLQGYPDHWTDIGEWTDTKGKKHKDADSPRYKALGNSIALPFWQWMAARMVKELNVEHPTMASLFDGIGGFPLVFSRCGCNPLWASEIEEFPIAVTKKRFK